MAFQVNLAAFVMQNYVFQFSIAIDTRTLRGDEVSAFSDLAGPAHLFLMLLVLYIVLESPLFLVNNQQQFLQSLTATIY